MATTVHFSGSYGHNIQMDLNYGTVTQNLLGNSSRIRVWVTLRSNGYGALWGTFPLAVNVNGVASTDNISVSLNANSSVTIWAKEYDIAHAGDGTKTVALSASLNVNTSGYGVASASANYPLATIARASTVSIGRVVIGGNVTISISRKNPSAKHTIRYGFGTSSGTIASNVDTNYSWQVPPELGAQIPNNMASKGTLWVDTYFGSTKAGTSAVVFDISVPDSYKPTLSSISLIDTNTKAQSMFLDAKTYVQEVSNIKVDFNGASGAYSSTLVQYEAVIVGKNNRTNQDGGTLGTMPYSGPAVVRARVQDSRGRWSDAVEVPITVLPYHRPSLSFAVVRGDRDGSKLSIKREAVVAPLVVGTAQKNSLTLTFKVAKGDSASFTVDKGPAAGTWTTQAAIVTEALLAGTYPTDSAWVVEGVLSDKFTSATFRVVVPTASGVGAYDKDGRWGFGQIPDRGKPGSINVAGDIYVGGFLLLDIFYPVGTIYESTASTNPSTFMGGSWERFGNGRVTVGVSETETEFNTVNKSGGSKTHTLTLQEIPPHTHTVQGGRPNNYVKVEGSTTTGYAQDRTHTTSSAGGGQAHNNLQPYVTVYRWRRTA